MSDMVERVARELCKATGDDWDWSVFYIIEARDTAETGRETYREMARAAIEAMRIGLTKAMMEAGCEAYANGNPDEYPSPSGMEAAFEAMISAALQD